MFGIVRRLLLPALLAAAHAQAQVHAQAQSWPDRPIRMLAGYPAGGGIDLVARLFGERIEEKRKLGASDSV